MTENKETLVQPAIQLAPPLAVLLLVFLCGLILRKLLFKRLTLAAKKAKSGSHEIIISATRGPSLIWLLMLGIYIALQFPKLPANIVNLAGKILLVLGLFSVTLLLANISATLINLFSNKWDRALPGASLTQTVTRIIIFVIGFPVLLTP